MKQETHINLGLATAWERTKGRRHRIQGMRYELRYAWQRAWRGYDDLEVTDLGDVFAERMTVLLKEYKVRNDCLLKDPETVCDCTEEETRQILDELIFYFENCSEDDVCQRLFRQPYYGMWIDKECRQKVHSEVERCRKEALRLFSKWCFELWY